MNWGSTHSRKAHYINLDNQNYAVLSELTAGGKTYTLETLGARDNQGNLNGTGMMVIRDEKGMGYTFPAPTPAELAAGWIITLDGSTVNLSAEAIRNLKVRLTPVHEAAYPANVRTVTVGGRNYQVQGSASDHYSFFDGSGWFSTA